MRFHPTSIRRTAVDRQRQVVRSGIQVSGDTAQWHSGVIPPMKLNNSCRMGYLSRPRRLLSFTLSMLIGHFSKLWDGVHTPSRSGVFQQTMHRIFFRPIINILVMYSQCSCFLESKYNRNIPMV